MFEITITLDLYNQYARCEIECEDLTDDEHYQILKVAYAANGLYNYEAGTALIADEFESCKEYVEIHEN